MPGKSFRVTEIAAQLSDELRQEFQELIDRAESNDRAANAKVKALLEKEQLLDQEKIRLEKDLHNSILSLYIYNPNFPYPKINCNYYYFLDFF